MLLVIALLLAVLGSGAMAGLFLAFSVAVMPALAREPAPSAAAVMQRVNVVVVRPVFLLVLGGTAVLAVAATVLAFLGVDDPAAATRWWAAAGTVAYLATAIGLTAGYHVPRNDALAAADPSTPEGERVWARYLREWVPLNHVRTVGCLLATACFAVALAGT